MIFKFIPTTAGGHVHIAVFCATEYGQAFAKMGDLTVRVGAEWAAYRSHLLHAGGGDERPDGSIVVEATSDDEAPDCVCRTPRCGHRASRHVGERGACVEPGCACGPGGWS